ncbi:hypothetical protein P7K49_007384, partial [Saguinus oedipus]
LVHLRPPEYAPWSPNITPYPVPQDERNNHEPGKTRQTADQGTVIHFHNTKFQASLAANTFTITGDAETEWLAEMLPSI